MTAPGIMRRFKMTKIAAVDSPAQKGARMTIMKNDDHAVEKALGQDLRDRFAREIKNSSANPTHDVSAAIRRLSQWAASGHYPQGTNYDDLKYMYNQAVKELKRRDPNSTAGGDFPGPNSAHKADLTDDGVHKCAALTGVLRIARARVGKNSTSADESRLRNSLRRAEMGLGHETLRKLAERIAKDAIDGDPDQAMLFDSVHGGTEAGEYADGMMDEFNECYRDLCASVQSIMGDDSVPDKGALLQETFKQFKTAIQDVVPEDLEPTIAKALGVNGRTSDMSKAIAEALGLKDGASESEMVAKAQELGTLAKMSAKHLEFMNDAKAKMPKGGKAAFMSMSPDERDSHMKANPVAEPDEDDVKKAIAKGDAFMDQKGAVFTKADFGSERAFEWAKGQAAEAKTNADKLAKAEESRLTAEFTKRAEPLGYVAKADELGQLLLDVAKFDNGLADRVEAVLKTASERIKQGELMREHGSSRTYAGAGNGLSKAAGQIDTLARDLLAKEPDLFKNAVLDKFAVAKNEVRKRNPELAKAEEAERKAA